MGAGWVIGWRVEHGVSGRSMGGGGVVAGVEGLTLVFEGGLGAALEGEGELPLRLGELRIEQREAADKVVIRHQLGDGEAAPRDSLTVERLGEAAPLHRADQILRAEAAREASG